MVKRHWPHLLVTLLTTVSLLWPSASQAASPGPAFVSLALPDTIAVGNTLHVVLVARAPAAGVESAKIYLSGPQGQVLSGVMTRQPGRDELLLDLPLSPLLSPGHWVVSELDIWSNEGASTLLIPGDTAGGKPFAYGVTITNPSDQVDLQPGAVRQLTISPTKPEPGEAISVSATLQAPPSGIARVDAHFRNTPATRRSSYFDPIHLFYNPTTGAWEGTTLAPIPPSSANMTLWLGWITITSNAGVQHDYVCWDHASDALPETCTIEVQAKATLRPGLITSPTLNLFWPGQPDFFTWADQDATWLRSLLPRLARDPALVRDLIAAQLPTLSRALASVRKEIYRDPLTGVTIATPNTTGKQLALAAALRGRLLLWGEIDRRLERTSSKPLTPEELDAALVLMDQYDSTPISREVLNQAGAVYTQRILETVNAAQLPAQTWTRPMAFNYLYLSDANLRPNVIWLLPYHSEQATGWHWDFRASRTIELVLPDKLPARPRYETIIHELGHQFHDTFLGGTGDSRSPRWAEYLALRGGQTWEVHGESGHDGRPYENFAEDFAKAIAPANLAPQIDSLYQYPALQNDPIALTRFHAFVLDLAQSTPPTAPTIDAPLDSLTVAGPGSYTLRGHGATSQELAIWSGPLTLGHLRSDGADRDEYQGDAAKDHGGAWLHELVPSSDPLQSVLVMSSDHRQSTFYANAALYRAALLLDHIPLSTAVTTLPVSGTTDPAATVTLGDQTTTADLYGSFQLPVDLAPGVNRLTLTALRPDGSRVFATTEVTAPGNDFPITVDAPVRSQTLQIDVVGQTQAGAAVDVNGHSTEADANGAFHLTIALLTGVTPLTVTATQDGRSAHWHGRVTVVPILTVRATAAARTAQEIVPISGQVTPGAKVTLGLTRVPVAPDGTFTVTVPLRPGRNDLRLVAEDGWSQVDWLQTVTRLHTLVLPLDSRRGMVDDTSTILPTSVTRLDSDNIYVPLQFVATKLGLTTDWDAATNTLVINGPSHRVVVTADTQILLLGDQIVTMTTPARLANGVLLVPYQYLKDLLPAQATWDRSEQAVLVTES